MSNTTRQGGSDSAHECFVPAESSFCYICGWTFAPGQTIGRRQVVVRHPDGRRCTVLEPVHPACRDTSVAE
jgi:hypothetical protein